jgi:GntR family transcriptional regulator, transcriptional repressor for pyruvate dehydrogenase complex
METNGKKHAGSLTEQVVAHVIAMIEDGSLAPGGKLPPESEIVRSEGVSRTVVREAISKLQAAGLVETRHGVGSFVREGSTGEGLRLKHRGINTASDVLAILEVRIGIETEAAALAARRRTNRNLQVMAAAMEAFKREIQRGHGAVDADFQFHLEIARAAHNPYFLDIFTALGSNAIPRSRYQIDKRGPQRQEYLMRINNEHEDIYNAILRGDAESARAAVRNHLGNSRERMRRATAAKEAQGVGNQ